MLSTALITALCLSCSRSDDFNRFFNLIFFFYSRNITIHQKIVLIEVKVNWNEFEKIVVKAVTQEVFQESCPLNVPMLENGEVSNQIMEQH